MTENYHMNKHKTGSILMQDISFCDHKTQHYEQKLYDTTVFITSVFTTDVKNVRRLQRNKHGGPYTTASLRCR